MTTQTWQIGDALELMKEYSNNYFNLILCDPPYGINVCCNGVNGFRGNAKPKDYGVVTWDSIRLDKEYFDEMIRISKNQIIFGGNYYTDILPPSPSWIVWDKDNGDSNFTDCELAWTSFKSTIRLFKYRWNGFLQENMKHKEKRYHPTQKPVSLFVWILKKFSTSGDIVLDPFLGSGPVLEACYQTGRNCIGFEIDPQWEYLYPIRSHKSQGDLNQWM